MGLREAKVGYAGREVSNTKVHLPQSTYTNIGKKALG